MPERYGMLIDGEFVEGTGDRRINVLNPADGELVGTVPMASDADIEAACQSAQSASAKWRDTPATARGQRMSSAINAIRARADEIARLLTMEQGKALAEAKGDVSGMCATLQFYAEEARRIEGKLLESDHADKMTLVMRSPVGVVAAIPPWNVPLQLLSRMLGPALAAGCTVVSKPSVETPLSTLMAAGIAVEAGLPPGVWNVITGPGSIVGEKLVQHPIIRKVSLTGSVEGGKRVMELAAKQIKRVTLELGGNCPCIVWNDFDLDRAADGIVFQAFRGSGQVCNRVNKVYAHREIAGDLIERIVSLAFRIVVGNGLKEGVDIGPLINERQWKWVDGHVKDAVEKGAKLECGGGRPQGAEFERGFFYSPTVLSNCDPTMRVMYEETFGPVLAVQTIDDDFEAALDLANHTPYGLSAYFFSNDRIRCYLAAQRLDAGSVWINDIHLSYVQAPYGGMRESGIGREQGQVAIDDYLEWKTVYWDMSGKPRGPYSCVHR
ncbi:MAG: NAD-dependent succinate-semialdehyde dehydrogenase [Chloroflexi bacterium]|nr:NAD-dependent succinate-semialdehyde dehydrogenase [Chloroflexota bacterium]